MTEKEQRAGKIEDSSSLTMLVVAPDAGIRKMLHMALRVEYGCEVLPFNNGRGALEAARIARPDMMVIHSMSPDLNALELAAHLHRIDGRERVPVILTHAPEVSYNNDQEPRLIILGQPFTLEGLYAAIYACLGHKKGIEKL